MESLPCPAPSTERTIPRKEQWGELRPAPVPRPASPGSGLLAQCPPAPLQASPIVMASQQAPGSQPPPLLPPSRWARMQQSSFTDFLVSSYRGGGKASNAQIWGQPRLCKPGAHTWRAAVWLGHRLVGLACRRRSGTASDPPGTGPWPPVLSPRAPPEQPVSPRTG